MIHSWLKIAVDLGQKKRRTIMPFSGWPMLGKSLIDMG